ncbi:DUF4172 domain-containing protein, partial [Leptospira borgpetersenii serovar Balcanica]|nr:DUF4172 domain-containing protein [Leptospira borgpetersenii serovar Balcanica]
SEIEGENLDNEQVRSSIARHLGIETGTLSPSPRAVDAVVEMVLAATYNFDRPLSFDDLFSWHHALFPTGKCGLYDIEVGQIRKDIKGPMRKVSGGYGREKVQYVAPNADRLPNELTEFINWLNTREELD